MFRSGFARCPLDGTPLQEIADDPLSGSTFADRYVIEACVGEGGMGRVYRARHQRVSRQFAVKVLFGDHAAESKMRERFGREAEAACRLSHPNVVSVLDYGETEAGLTYLVMDWVEGRDLRSIIQDEGPLEADRVADIVRQLCLGLGHAHDKGLVHRDFKGENVIIARDGDRETPRIVDFGIAVILEGNDSGRLTTEGIVVGTPAYMSPEQATAAEELDHRSDLFSLGVLMYEMLAGVLPFEGSPLAIARQNLAADPPPIGERVLGLVADAALERISMRLMEKRPDDRFASAQDVIAALDERSAGVAQTLRAVPSGPHAGEPEDVPEEAEAPRRSRAGLIAAVVAALAVAAVVVGVAVRPGNGDATKLASPPVPDAQPAAPSPDAGVAVATAPPVSSPDAAPPAVAATTRRPRRVRAKPDAAAVATAAPAPDASPPKPRAPKPPPPPKPMSTSDLESLYVTVGTRIDALERERGGAVARPFRDEYFRIPFADALRTPGLRDEVAGKLRGLRRRVDAARKN